MVELAVMAVIVEFALMVGLVLGGEVTGAAAVVAPVECEGCGGGC